MTPPTDVFKGVRYHQIIIVWIMCALGGVRHRHSRIILRDLVCLGARIYRWLLQITPRISVCRNVHLVLIISLIISRGLACSSAHLACLLILRLELVCRVAQLDRILSLNPIWECVSLAALRQTMLRIWLNNVWDYAPIYQSKPMLKMWVVFVLLDAWMAYSVIMSLENAKLIVSHWQIPTQTRPQIYV